MTAMRVVAIGLVVSGLAACDQHETERAVRLLTGEPVKGSAVGTIDEGLSEKAQADLRSRMNFQRYGAEKLSVPNTSVPPENDTPVDGRISGQRF